MFLHISEHKLTEEEARKVVKKLGVLAMTTDRLLELSDDWIHSAVPLHMIRNVRLIPRQPFRRYLPAAICGAALLVIALVGALVLWPLASILQVSALGILLLLAPLGLVFFGVALLVPTGRSRKYMWLNVRTTKGQLFFQLRRNEISLIEAEEFARLIEQSASHVRHHMAHAVRNS